MRRPRFAPLTLALVSLLWLSGAGPALARQEKPASRVTIPQSAGPAGGSVDVPVQLAAGEGVQIASIALTLRFPASQLTFEKVEIGGLGETVGARATAKVQTSEGETSLEIRIAAAEKDGATPPLPDGPIAHVMFTVAAGLEPEAVVPLEVQASGAATAPRAGPIAIAVRNSAVIVSHPSAIGCFFYMH